MGTHRSLVKVDLLPPSDLRDLGAPLGDALLVFGLLLLRPLMLPLLNLPPPLVL